MSESNTVSYDYRKKLKSLSPHMQELLKNKKDASRFVMYLDTLIVSSKKRFRRGDANLCLGVILTQLKIWDPNDRSFLLDLYDFNDIDEDCYDYKRALKIAQKIRTQKEFYILDGMLNK